MKIIDLRKRTVIGFTSVLVLFALVLGLFSTPLKDHIQTLNACLSLGILILLFNIWAHQRQLSSAIRSKLDEINEAYARLQALADVLEADYGREQFSKSYKDMDGDAFRCLSGKPSKLN